MLSQRSWLQFYAAMAFRSAQMVPPAVKQQKANGHAVHYQRYKMLLHTMSEIMNDKKVKLWICMSCIDVQLSWLYGVLSMWTGRVLRWQDTLLLWRNHMWCRAFQMHSLFYQERDANVGKAPCQSESSLGKPERSQIFIDCFSVNVKLTSLFSLSIWKCVCVWFFLSWSLCFSVPRSASWGGE